MLQRENTTLKATVGQLQSELKTMRENFESTRAGRNSILNGCPILIEKSGLIFTSKSSGELKSKTEFMKNDITGELFSAVVQRGPDVGMLTTGLLLYICIKLTSRSSLVNIHTFI